MLCSCLLGRTAACWSSWATLIRGALHSASITLCSHGMVSQNPSLGVYLEPWNPWKVLEMHWASCYRRGLLQWQYCHAKKLPHPFSRSFVKLYFIFLGCCFLLYRRNYGYNLFMPFSFIESNCTWYLCFSVSFGWFALLLLSPTCIIVTACKDGKPECFVLFVKHHEVFSEIMHIKGNLPWLFYPQVIILVWKSRPVISTGVNRCSSIKGFAMQYWRALPWRM